MREEVLGVALFMMARRAHPYVMVAGSHGCLDDAGRGAAMAALGIGEPRRILVITLRYLDDVLLMPLPKRIEIP